MSEMSTFILAFLKSVQRTLQVTCSMPASPGKPFVKGTRPQTPVALTGSSDIMSGACSRQIRICFTMPMYEAILSNMLGQKPDSMCSDLEDGAAALLNIMLEQTHLSLNQVPKHSCRSRVIKGDTVASDSSHTLVIPFKTQAGEIQIEFEPGSSEAEIGPALPSRRRLLAESSPFGDYSLMRDDRIE